jgi:hypothetical protein
VRLGLVMMVLLLIACGESKEVPKDVIPQEKMQLILWDMILADRYSNQFLIKDTAKLDLKLETFMLYDEVFQVHQIDKERFVKSYKFYLSRPDLLKAMFDTLSVRANKEKETLYKPTPSTPAPKPQ